MPTHRTLADIAAEIARSGVPSLFVDTCAALDVVRCATRGRPEIAAIARQVIDAQASGKLLLFAPSVLLDEAARNRVEVEGAARRSARQIDEAMGHHRHVAGIIGAAYPHAQGFAHDSLIAPLLALHDQLLASSVHVIRDLTIADTALRRAGSRRRPARGGGGANDCLMFEEFRHVALAVPSADPLVLLTTNTDDFGAEKGSRGLVHPEITDDLVPTKARVCLNWGEAAAIVLTPARLKSL
jgi:hypothetical protein